MARNMFSHRSSATWRHKVRVGCQALTLSGFMAVFAPVPLIAEASDEAFENRVRDYLLSNPEIILEALEILSQRETRAVMAEKIAKYPDLFDAPPVLGLGPKNATTTVVEFFDYRCAPCKALHPELKAALKAHPDIRVEMRHLPILSPGSERGARFALAVKAIGGADVYGAVHDDIWKLKRPLRDQAFQEISQNHGLSWTEVQTAMNSDAVSGRIARNRDIAIDLEILGTPAFVTPTSVSFGQTDAGKLIEGWLSQ